MEVKVLSSTRDKSLMVVNIKTTVFLDVTRCNMLETCRLLPRRRGRSYTPEDRVETVLPSETSLIFHNIAWSHILHDGNADPPPEVQKAESASHKINKSFQLVRSCGRNDYDTGLRSLLDAVQVWASLAETAFQTPE
jgi:hypothetical protein